MQDNNEKASSLPVRPLPVLRAMIDSLDHDLLHLLARRNALVAEIAQYKREHTVPIRDLVREKELISDRRDRALPLGLSPEMVESLFRLLLWASRDRQAALRAEVPVDVEPRTIAVIGGKGGIGKTMASLFGDLGHAVMIADLDTRLTPAEAAANGDVVIISVPIDATEKVVEELGPLVREDALLMDVTSIKCAPVNAMMRHCRGSVAGTHPLFGPSVHSLQGQRIVLTPGKGKDWFDWLKQMLHARGLNILETTPEDHDRAMAVVQVLVHFSTEVVGRTLSQLDISLEETLRFTSPIYLMELLMTARHFAQSPDLYSSIQMSNPKTSQVTDTFVRVAQELQHIDSASDHAAFAKLFSEVRDFFGPFTDRAMQQSDFLIDRLVERA